jgi:hypothetical protein
MVRQIHTKPIHTKPIHTKPIHTKPIHTKPIHTKSGHTKSGHTQPNAERATATQIRLLERPSRLYARPLRLRFVTDQRFSIPETKYWVPQTFQVGGQHQTVQRAVGPERIESQWWEGRWVRRDYFRIHTESGQRFWIFQELGTHQWWIHGDFA